MCLDDIYLSTCLNVTVMFCVCVRKKKDLCVNVFFQIWVVTIFVLDFSFFFCSPHPRPTRNEEELKKKFPKKTKREKNQ